MNEALELAGEMQRYGVTTMNRWATDGAAMLRSQHAEIERLKANANICGIGAGCLHKEATIESQAAEIEILKQEHAQRTMFKKTDDAAFVKQVKETTELRVENQKLREALESIALAGMSGSGQQSDEGIRNWHARRAWEFIGIAARALGETK